eukprot:356778-Chlamydomonas_euryale.AAC.2
MAAAHCGAAAAAAACAACSRVVALNGVLQRVLAVLARALCSCTRHVVTAVRKALLMCLQAMTCLKRSVSTGAVHTMVHCRCASTAGTGAALHLAVAIVLSITAAGIRAAAQRCRVHSTAVATVRPAAAVVCDLSCSMI